MLKQIIHGEEFKLIKYHGNVKHIIFECNTCHERFSKMESYYKKQLKKRKYACCFCSPRCRSIYFTGKAFAGSSNQNTISSILKKVFGKN